MKLIELIDIQPQNVKWLYDLHSKGLIEVDESFQRQYVWIQKHQIKLIETILIGYPIPEIYLWNTGTESDTGNTKYSIIDGQQRTGAIFQFIQNKFKLNEAILSNSTAVYDDIKNRFFKDLEDAQKQAIWSYVFSVRMVRTNVSRNSIVQMFLRLNSSNMTLNPQELRNAEFEGEFLKLAADLSLLKFWEKNRLFGIADRRRMRDITFVSNLLTFMKLGINEEISAKNINRVYSLYNEKYPNKIKDKNNFIAITDIIDSIIEGNSYRKKFLSRKVHLYSLFTLLYPFVAKQKDISKPQLAKYRNFIDNYDNDVVLKKYFKADLGLILEYKTISVEGTNRKTNRIRRFEILEKLIK